MDDIVKAALAKWPNVPAAFGWLGLDARGDWYLRDEAVQRAGPFSSARGSRIEHDKLIAFIGRNYDVDAQGRWYFQNGPQRVFVSLEAAPWIVGVQRHHQALELTTHTGVAVDDVQATWVDETGRLYVQFEKGLGLVRSTDMHAAADAVEAGLWAPQACVFADLPVRHGYQLEPLP